MRKRRIDAKTRVAIRAFLSGQTGAVEICQFISPHLFWDKELLNETDSRFINEVAGHISKTLLKAEWHPDFVDSKFKSIEAYEAMVRGQVEAICQQILHVMEDRKRNVKIHEDPQDIRRERQSGGNGHRAD